MKITDLIIAPESLGEKLWLTEVSAVYEYKDNRRTENIVGYRYTICLPDKQFEKLGVKVDGKKLLETPESYASVKFDGLEVFIYWLNGQPQVGAKATNISLVNNKA